MEATIAVLPGDGIGPEVTEEAVKVLEAVGQGWGHRFTFNEALLGGCAIDATGSAMPDETLRVCQAADAVLLGAVGGPKWDDPNAKVRPEQGLLGIRKALGLFANLRPVRVFPELRDASPLRPDRLEGVDLLVVRELTGGIYFGKRERTERAAFDTCEYTVEEIERVCRMAGRLARERRGYTKAGISTSSRRFAPASISPCTVVKSITSASPPISVSSSSGVSIIITSAHFAASATSITLSFSSSAFLTPCDPLRSATATPLTPESRRLSAWAWPWLP
jgi:isocitrate dehydrogenase